MVSKHLKPLLTTQAGRVGSKKAIDDAVGCFRDSTKGFAQSFIPLVTYYKALR
ncbi:MAG: hypothetical protein ACLT33_14545 [Lachnospira pectinoschiza]